jgi:uncharacterized membrane protein
MSLAIVVRVVAIACAGMLAGIYFGHLAGPQYALHALDASAFVQFQQVVHVHYVRFMPPLVLGALIGALVWLVTLRRAWRSPEFWLVAVSAVAIAIIAGLTRAINVPLNNALMTWNVAAPPPDLRQIWAPWEQVNTARAWLAIGALLLEAFALNLRTPPA